MPASFQFLHHWSNRPKCDPSSRRNLSISGIQQIWLAQQGKNHPETCWVGDLAFFSGSEIVGFALPGDIKLQSWRFDVCIAGGVCKIQLHLAAAFRHLRRDIGSGNEESRLCLPRPKGTKLVQNLEPIDILHFHYVLLRVRGYVDLNQSVRTNLRVPIELRLPLQHS